MKKILAIFTLLFFGLIGVLSAQTVVTMGGSQTDVTGCDFVVYDHGGLNGNYANNRNDLLTIHSNDPAAACVQIRVILTDFNIHWSDTLYIYDGTTDADSLLVGAINDSVVYNVTSNDVVFTATVMNPSGALTLKFVSDGDSIGRGYVIKTECVAPCQRVGLEIDSLLSSHIPFQDADGFFYVNLCENDTLHMVVNGVFPDNDFSYHQSNETNTFTWDLGVEVLEGEGMNVLDYTFETGRGYDIAISNVDSAGCANTMPIIFRVRTSGNPIKKVSQLPPMCTGDAITVSATYSNLSVIQVDSIYSEQLTTLKVLDTIFLPDGVDCGSGCAYQSPVTFTAFSPSATIQSPDDILYVRIKLEHSFIGDIYIALTCPNGQYAKILKKYGSGSTTQCSGMIPLPWGWNVTTGIGSGSDFGVVGGSNGSNCDESANPMGTTWNYCWSNNTNPQYGYQYAAGQGYVYESVNQTNSRVDSTNTVNMTNVYHPDESFASLIGCPMNGTWAITVIDGWGADNGWITEWEMALDPSLLPQDWSYTVHPDTLIISGPGVEGQYIIPDSSGNIAYTATVIDEFGCAYDTLLNIDVVERPHPDLGPDTIICHGDIYNLSSNYHHENTSYVWNTGERTPDIFLASAGDYSVRITVTNDEGLACSGADTIHIGVAPKPIPAFYASDTAGCSPLQVRLYNTSTADGMDMFYYWTVFDENGNIAFTSDKREPDFKFETSGTYTIRLVTTTALGCVDSTTYIDYITVNYQPTAEFDALPDVSLWSESDGNIQFCVQGDTLAFGDEMTFLWDFGDGETDSTSFNQTHNYNTWGDYDVTLSMSTPQGCNSSITHRVALEADLVFPNVITPNGDGVNDVFAIGNLNSQHDTYNPDNYRNNELFIYDRWGKQVYHAENYDTFIDMTGQRGTDIQVGENVFDGSKCTDGSYFYTFYYKGKLKTVNYHGTLQIIRDRK